MKVILASLSALCFIAAPIVLLAAFSTLNGDLQTESSSECITQPPVSQGATQTERCEGNDESAAVVGLSVTGGGILVAGAVLALAAVSVREPVRPQPFAGSGAPAPSSWPSA